MSETSSVYMLRVESMQAGVSYRFVSYDPVNLEGVWNFVVCEALS